MNLKKNQAEIEILQFYLGPQNSYLNGDYTSFTRTQNE